MACPRCHSTDFRSNRIETLTLGQAAANLWAAHRAGRGTVGLRGLLGWACVQAANTLRDPWSCDHCRESFR